MTVSKPGGALRAARHVGSSFRSRKLTGLLLLSPALCFVIVFTVYPFLQMLWMSLHNWSIIEPERYVGLKNYLRIIDDQQFWVSLRFTLQYTLWITPILMILGFLIALLTTANTPVRRVARGMVFIPVVIGLGVSSLLWYWLFSYDFGLINRALLDIGLISRPVVWLGASAELVLWVVIVSVVWKVVGFGMLLFVAAIQSVPLEINDAARVDGARYWARVRLITLPMTLRTILLVTLVSIIGSLLAFDQFYIMTAGQPHNATATSVFWVYLNSFPYLKLGYGSALSLVLTVIVLACTVIQMMLDPTESQMIALQHRMPARGSARAAQRRNGYLVAAVCVALCTIMAMPLLLTVLASFKTTLEAAALPPTYIPHQLSLDSYVKLWGYQAGLLTYAVNSGTAACLTIVFCLVLTIPAGYALARFPVPAKEGLFIILLMALLIPYQALLTPIFFMFIQLKLTNSLVGLAIVHTAIQLPFSVYIMRNAFESLPNELDEAATVDGCSPWQALTLVYVPSIRPAIVTVSLFAFITSWNELLGSLVMMSKGTTFTLPIILAVARTETSIGGTDWGLLQAGVAISVVPCVLFYLLLQKYYVSGLLSGAVK